MVKLKTILDLEKKIRKKDKMNYFEEIKNIIQEL